MAALASSCAAPPAVALSVKDVVEKASSGGDHNLVNTIPPSYAYYTNNSDDVNGLIVEAYDQGATNSNSSSNPNSNSIPTIDFSLLMSPDIHQRSQAVRDLGKACQDWGFFIVVNHGVADDMFNAMMNAVEEFFNLPAKEKMEFAGEDVMDPIRCGTSFNFCVEKVHLWRDFLKCFVHPQFHFPNKPQGFSELAREYCGKVREVARGLLGGISESLGLEASYLVRTMDVTTNGLQILSINYYPPCPQPELAAGLPPHTEHGFLTMVAQNGVDGLQTKHVKHGKWVPVHAPPNAFMVNLTDHLEIVTNGRYKSNIHRAVVNNKTTRISLAVLNGPSLDCEVSPAPVLVDNDLAAYRPMKYREYIELQQNNKLHGKSSLDRVRLMAN